MSGGAYLEENSDEQLRFKMHTDKVPELTRALVNMGVDIREIRSTHSLEAYFISLTNQLDAKAGVI